MKQRDAEAQVKAELQKQLEEFKQRQPSLEAENQELRHRQQLQQDELFKAEAQIELIKDLLLRDAGL